MLSASFLHGCLVGDSASPDSSPRLAWDIYKVSPHVCRVGGSPLCGTLLAASCQPPPLASAWLGKPETMVLKILV